MCTEVPSCGVGGIGGAPSKPVMATSPTAPRAGRGRRGTAAQGDRLRANAGCAGRYGAGGMYETLGFEEVTGWFRAKVGASVSIQISNETGTIGFLDGPVESVMG